MLLLDTPASELICQALVRLSWDCCRCNDHIVGLSPRKKCGEKNEPAPLSSSLIKSWIADGIFCSFQCGTYIHTDFDMYCSQRNFQQKTCPISIFSQSKWNLSKILGFASFVLGSRKPAGFHVYLSTSSTSTGH